METNPTLQTENIAISEERVSSIFKNKNFLLLWTATLLSSFGISFFMFSQSWYVVQVLNLEASLGFIYIASSIPRLIFMLISGTVADRYSKTKIMISSVLSRSILLIGLVIWFLLGDVSLWTFVGFAFFFGILDAFFWAAESALLPSLIHKDNLTRGNSIIQMTNQSSFILAPILAGVIIAFGSYEIVFGTTAIMLLVASILLALMKIKKNSSLEENKEQQFWETFREGFSYMKSSKVLLAFILTSVFLNLFLVGPMSMGLPLFVKNILHGDSLDFSFLEASIGVGMLIGTVVVGILNLRKHRGIISLALFIAAGFFFFILSFTTELWQSVLALGLFGICLSCANIPIIAVIQTMVEEKMLGRVMGLLSLSSMGLIPVSYVITSFFLSIGISIHYIMATGSLLVIAYAIFILVKLKEIRAVQ
jgi:MFS family permease